MKISKRDVIDKNKTLLSRIVSDIRQGDDLDLIAKRVGDRVTVSPDNMQAEQITITFHINAVMVVSKGAELNNIASLIRAAANGPIQALGTNLAGSMTAGAGIAGASLQTLTEIMATQSDEGNQRIQVEITEIDHPASGSIKVTASATATGWTKTTDWDSDEQANFSHIVRLLTPGNRVKTKNVGTESQIRIEDDASVVTTDISSSTALAIVDLDWNLKTDGAFSIDTVSLVQIADVTLVVKYGEP